MPQILPHGSGVYASQHQCLPLTKDTRIGAGGGGRDKQTDSWMDGWMNG